MIEKLSGRVAYAVMSFGGFLGMGGEEHAIPWSKLTYDTRLDGYQTDISETQLQGAPAFSRDRNWDWSDRSHAGVPSSVSRICIVCRLHGGLSPGAPRGSRNGNYRRGDWTTEAIEERRWLRSLVQAFAKTGTGR